MSGPYHIEGPAAISVSGGLSSAYLLHQVVSAHGGRLPDGVVAIFANTGEELPSTLDFVHELELRLAPIVWVELAGRYETKVVTYETASRGGQPFDALVSCRKMLPNRVMRFCTTELKARRIMFQMRALGHVDYTNVLGIRADEQRRAASMRGRGAEVSLPLVAAGHSWREVDAFWAASDYALPLPRVKGRTAWGNCVWCFMKGMEQTRSMAATIASLPTEADREFARASLRRMQARERRIASTFRGPNLPDFSDIERAAGGDLLEVTLIEEQPGCYCGD